jgi:hypothetical protein
MTMIIVGLLTSLMTTAMAANAITKTTNVDSEPRENPQQVSKPVIGEDIDDVACLMSGIYGGGDAQCDTDGIGTLGC